MLNLVYYWNSLLSFDKLKTNKMKRKKIKNQLEKWNLSQARLKNAPSNFSPIYYPKPLNYDLDELKQKYKS